MHSCIPQRKGGLAVSFMCCMLALVALASAGGTPCREMGTLSIVHGALNATLSPFFIHVYPYFNDKTYDAYLGYRFVSMAERARSVSNGGNGAVEPSNGCWVPFQTDPLSTSPNYGPLLQYYMMEDMNCTLNVVTDFPRPETNRTTYNFTLTTDAAPSLITVISYMIVNNSYDDILSNSTTYTNGTLLTAHYLYECF